MFELEKLNGRNVDIFRTLNVNCSQLNPFLSSLEEI